MNENSGVRLRKSLARGPILLDAAMGTRLIARGLDLTRDDPALWVIDHPLEVLHIHQRDFAAGSTALLTNTFGANRAWLDRLGEGDQVRAINQQAVRMARRTVGPDGVVLGTIGPTTSDHPEALLEQVEILLESGVDALILETHRLDQAESSLRRLRNVSLPILASLYDWPDPIEDAAHRLIDAGSFAIGGNCQVGMASGLALARRLRAVTDHPLLIKPSAGLPGSVLDPPEAFGAAIPELLALGVGLIGGCCGTTEAHIEAMKRRISTST